jgi:hypothetical protein
MVADRWHFLTALALSCCIVLGGACDDGSGTDADADGDTDEDAGCEGNFLRPDGYCPGPASCPDEGDGGLKAGAAKVSITPVIDEDPIWMAGFGNGRTASSINDPQWARAIVLQTNETTIALVAVDCVGLFHEDVVEIRDLLSGLDIDYVAVTATRTHGAQDSIGIWGLDYSRTGMDLDAMNTLRAGAAEAVETAFGELRPTEVEHSSVRLRDQPGGVLRYVSDSRDPVIIDDEIRLMRFVEVGADTTIATMANVSIRADYSGSTNQALTSDIAHYVRDAIENGAGPDDAWVDGVGGVAVFVAGSIGGMPTSAGISAETWEGEEIGNEGSLELAEVVGQQIGYFALQALTGDDVERVETASLGFRYLEFPIHVENLAFLGAFELGLFPTRETFCYDPYRPIGPGNWPHILSEIAVVEIGDTTLLLVPGHLDPSLFVGGYDDPYPYTPESEAIVTVENHGPDHAPDLGAAPDGPYLRDVALMRGGCDRVHLVGMANDEIGYFVPDFEFDLDDGAPYIRPADNGNHYEETFSLGPDAWGRVEHQLLGLLAWEPEEEGR